MRSKYFAQRVTADGQVFHSKREYRRWKELQLLAQSGEIKDLKRQVSFPLEVNGALVCTYIADYVYSERRGEEWHRVVEDSKGYKGIATYRLKAKLMLAVHGIKIREV